MSQVSTQLFQAWTHSFEEDDGGVQVYRPSSYRFPAQRRPRESVEFRADGTFTLLNPGPADKRERIEGRWQADAPGRLRVTTSRNPRESTIDIIQVDAALLKIREQL